jgi:hypothetical protein
MARNARLALIAALLGPLGLLAAPAAAAPSVYRGMCDASAAVGLTDDRFVVANDEDNILRVYRRGVAEAESEFDLSAFLGADDEADIEGAARIGDRIYWIASHGQNKKAKDQPSRQRLFATDISTRDGRPWLTPVAPGPFKGLRAELFADRLKPLGLQAAAALAPEKGGLNIEGLAMAPDGGLLAGLRSPVTADGAVVLWLDLSGGLDHVVVKDWLILNLGPGVGIRSLERVGSDYRVLAGPSGAEGGFRLYRWAGPPSRQVALLLDPPMHPEALFVSGSGRLEILSDDGDEPVGDGPCKDAPPQSRAFRGDAVGPGAAPGG